jgi:hypothetical protein
MIRISLTVWRDDRFGMDDLIQLDAGDLAALQARFPDLKAIPVYWANFGTELEPKIEVWPAEMSLAEDPEDES